MDKIALIFSIVSLFVSLFIAGWQIYCSKKINDVNLQAEFTREIFKRYMTEILPNAFLLIKFPKKKLSGIDGLQNALNSFRQELKFLKFSDKHFYKRFKKRTQALEDYIVINCDKEFDNDDQMEVLTNIAKKLSSIYKLINKKYKNG